MYAVIETGGKQYSVSPGQRLKIELLPNAIGEAIKFDKVLLIADGDQQTVGAPYLQDYAVNATVISQGRHDKIHIIKFRRRKHFKKQMGHRQYYTEVKVGEISGK